MVIITEDNSYSIFLQVINMKDNFNTRSLEAVSSKLKKLYVGNTSWCEA
jgi:hypothetical protein